MIGKYTNKAKKKKVSAILDQLNTNISRSFEQIKVQKKIEKFYTIVIIYCFQSLIDYNIILQLSNYAETL